MRKSCLLVDFFKFQKSVAKRPFLTPFVWLGKLYIEANCKMESTTVSSIMPELRQNSPILGSRPFHVEVQFRFSLVGGQSFHATDSQPGSICIGLQPNSTDTDQAVNIQPGSSITTKQIYNLRVQIHNQTVNTEQAVNPHPGSIVDPNYSEDLQPGSKSKPFRRFTARQQIQATWKIYNQAVDPDYSEDFQPGSRSRLFRRFTTRQQIQPI